MQKTSFFAPACTGRWAGEFSLGPDSPRLTHVAGELWMQELEFTQRDFSWSTPFPATQLPQRQEPIAP